LLGQIESTVTQLLEHAECERVLVKAGPRHGRWANWLCWLAIKVSGRSSFLSRWLRKKLEIDRVIINAYVYQPLEVGEIKLNMVVK